MRWLRRVVYGLIVFFGLLVAFVWYTLKGSVAVTDGTVIVQGLGDQVQIDRDVLGVPNITASSRDDLAFALGFLHAQERFFQMDLLRRSAAGELAELFGRAALTVDQRVRVHRFRHIADQALSGLSGSQHRQLGAYADGVNAGLQALNRKPFEYLILRSEPEPWLRADTILALYAMYLDLHDERGDKEARRAVLKDLLPIDVYAFLQPQGTEWDAALDGSTMAQPDIPAASVFDLREMDRTIFAMSSEDPGTRPETLPGSNNWAVSGKRTSHGAGIVANDMHLGLRVPNIWYRVSLTMTGRTNDDEPESFRITGVSLPGTPFIVAGSNGHIAWGFTNSYGDWVDRVILDIDPADATRYLSSDGYRAFDVIREPIMVRGEEQVVLEIEQTIWGPVIGADYAGRKHAVLWTAHRPDATAGIQLSALENVTSVVRAIEVAQQIGIPPQNFVVADSAGNIGWTLMGRIPVRGDYDARVPVHWNDLGNAWSGWVDPEDHPSIINPENGIIWTANARVVSGTDLALIGDGGYALGARAGQIRDNLLAREFVTVSDMLEIQLDDRALFLVRWQELLVDLMDRNEDSLTREQRLYRDLVRDWNPRAAIDSVGYRLIRAWRYTVIDAIEETLFAELKIKAPEIRLVLGMQAEGPVWRLIDQQPEHMLNPLYPSWDAWLMALVQETSREFTTKHTTELAQRTWGERNTANIVHPLSQALPQLSRWLDMPRQPLPGATYMPRVQSPSFGASERFAVAPGREDEAYLHMPSGQSGHPLSPYFGAGHMDWVEGRPSAFLPGEPVYRLTLLPNQ